MQICASRGQQRQGSRFEQTINIKAAESKPCRGATNRQTIFKYFRKIKLTGSKLNQLLVERVQIVRLNAAQLQLRDKVFREQAGHHPGILDEPHQIDR